MQVFDIPYSETQKFSKLILDYLAKDKKIKPFIIEFKKRLYPDRSIKK